MHLARSKGSPAPFGSHRHESFKELSRLKLYSDRVIGTMTGLRALALLGLLAAACAAPQVADQHDMHAAADAVVPELLAEFAMVSSQEDDGLASRDHLTARMR